MTLWTFNLRSNDSDIEDEETDSPQNITSSHTNRSQQDTQTTRQKQTNKELEELFGTAEEESVEYKPNPWRIAKINANSRNTAPLIKPKPKKTWKPASNSSSKPSGLERFWKNPKGVVKDGCVISPETNVSQSPNAGKSLRDSISEALRRGGPAAITQYQNIQARSQNNAVGKSTGWREPQLTDTTPSLDTRQPLYNYIPPGSRQEPMSRGFAPDESNAYIPDGPSTIPGFDKSPRATEDLQRLDASSELFSDDTYPLDKLVIPAPGSGDQYTQDDSLCLLPQVYDEEASSDGFLHTPVDLRPDSQWENTFTERRPDRFRIPSPPPGPEWTSQNQVRLASPYSDTPIRNWLEPSPTVQLISKFAAPKLHEPAASKYSEYSNPGDESPIFAWSPPSPTPQHTQPNRNRVYPSHTPKRTSHTTQNPLSTPPRKKTHRFDPDDKPFWSTLPTPPNSNLKPATSGIKTTRFRLPGSFVGNGSSGRTLYKPPPRKKTRSRGDEESGIKWKVTRVG